MVKRLNPVDYADLVHRALLEDVGSGDATTQAIVPKDLRAVGRFVVKRACVLAGLDVARAVFAELDASTELTAVVNDGDRCEAGMVVATVVGSAASLLTGERTALNFLQRLAGIATLARQFAEAAGGTLTVIDTRKTTPTLRALEKYAVRCGGARNHRLGLFDAILIKDNHIQIAGGLEEAVARVRARSPELTVEVETQSLEEVDRAIAVRADVIMLDNLSEADMREAVRRIGGRAQVEISGNVTLDRIPALAALGADTVSVGALTHSAPAADLSFEMTCLNPSRTT